MIKRSVLFLANALQVAGIPAVIYGGFLLADFVGWLLLGVGLVVVGMALEREAVA